MCGIAGIVDFTTGSADPAMIRRMTDGMAHRGPDADAFLTEGEIAFGHRRLSIIDLSSAANQPFIDHSGRYVLVFNGEIYNYQEVKAMLPDYPFHTTSDTEVLIAAFVRWGAGCLDRLKGMFAFAIWDRREKELFMARDRMGVKPLYYHWENGRLLFASEIRAILATGLVPVVLDPAALLDYFSYQSVSYPHSMIAGIRQVEAASWIRLKNDSFKKELYWDVTTRDMDFDFGNKTIVLKRVRELMLQSVERRLVSDVPVGAFLSGGIDSSAVVGLMAEAGATAPNTFNIAFEEKEYDESEYADIVARKFGARHEKILLRPTIFLDELTNALSALDTPSGDGINTYVVSKAIRAAGIKVALSGVGGDELFAGYPFFAQYERLRKTSWLWSLPPAVRRTAAGLLGASRGKGARMGQLLELSSPSIANAYPVFRQILSPSLLRRLTRLDASGAIPSGSGSASRRSSPTSLQQSLLERQDRLDKLPLLSQVSAAEYLGYTQHTLLKDTDQMSMAVSLEVREPFFDHELVRFVLAMPDELKRPTYPKSLMVEALKPLLPDEIVFRKKRGFLFPWNTWMRTELKTFCEQHVNNMAQRPFIEGDALRAYWNSFLAGEPGVRWAEIWLFVVLEYWLEKNNIS